MEADHKIDYDEFCKLTHGLFFLKRVLEWDLTIPHFDKFRHNLQACYQKVKEDVNNEYSWGEVATYIPPLAKADPKWFATGFCSTDSQFCQFGDIDNTFSIQSIGKVVAYAYIHNIMGDEVHSFVGKEPSGVAFNAPVFDKQGKPHNPMVNTGAIMVCSLIVHQGKNIDDVMEFYRRASDQVVVEVDEELYHDEKLTGYTNHALTNLMLANNVFPKKANAHETKVFADESLDLYFKNCSVLVNTQSLAKFGAMLANNGINPSTGDRILRPATVKAVVTLMTSCGMYDGAGSFIKDLGVPSKSGVSGGLLSVIPGLGAFATWSPPLNAEGNTVRGIQLIHELSAIYNNFNLFHRDVNVADVTRKPFQTLIQTVIAACSCAANGDMEGISRLFNSGVDLTKGDYDQRTPLHLAAAAGHVNVVQYLILQCEVPHSPRDRWGATPLNDAKKPEIVEFLVS